MPMAAHEIEELILAALPDATVEIRDLAGDGDHYAARVVSKSFEWRTPKTKRGCRYGGVCVKVISPSMVAKNMTQPPPETRRP